MKHTRKIKIDGFEVLEATTDNEVKKKKCKVELKFNDQRTVLCTVY